MAITDISISEELMTNAPSIKYRGNEGPKSPQEMQMMMVDDALDEAYEQYIFDLLEQRPDATPMSKEEFRRMVIMEGMMGGGNPLPEDPTKPINPFGPKPTGPVLPNKRQMAAFGGIMGLDGRRQYGIGSYFQKLKDKFVDDLIPNEIKDNPELAAAAALVGANYLDVIPGSKDSRGYIGELFDKLPEGIKEAPEKVRKFIFEKPEPEVMTDRDGNVVLGKDNKPIYKQGQSIAQQIGSGLAKNIVPILGGVTAGLFTKNQPEQPGLPDDTTALNLADLKKGANLATQQQGIAAGLNFLPAVAARQFTPEEMAITYAQTAKAANGGRIGFSDGGEDLSDDPSYKGWLKTYEMNPDAAEMNENHAKYLSFYNKTKKAEGGLMDLGGLEKDYRAEGGFVPIGKREKADDVPARLSVNEFVFTADAVRNAGGGDVDEGAKVMERVMKHLEAGGKMSRESQGMSGARDMFAVSERLSEVV
jgi:uncharacterized short protein YbdD (DUF466 family)